MSDDARLRDLYVDLASLFKDGMRCRYDPALLEQMPLQEGVECIPKEQCFQCGYEERYADEFCKTYLNVWGILAKMYPDKYGPGGTEA